jgi:hypothetical protein
MHSQKLIGWLGKNFVLQGLVVFQGTGTEVPEGGYNNTDIATTSFMLIRRLAPFRPLPFRLFYRPEGQVGFRWQPADEKTRLLA